MRKKIGAARTAERLEPLSPKMQAFDRRTLGINDLMAVEEHVNIDHGGLRRDAEIIAVDQVARGHQHLFFAAQKLGTKSLDQDAMLWRQQKGTPRAQNAAGRHADRGVAPAARFFSVRPVVSRWRLRRRPLREQLRLGPALPER